MRKWDLMQTSTSTATTRIWTNKGPDDGSVHCLGNGLLCAYEVGPDIMQVFGPPYSSPVLGAVTLDVAEPVQVQSSREAGTAIWTHQLQKDGESWAEMVDFVDSSLPCLVRRVRTQKPLHLEWSFSGRMVNNSQRVSMADGSLICEIPAGTPFYSHYPYPRPVFYQIAWRGTLTADGLIENASQNGGWLCMPGESWLFLIGGPEYPQAIEHTEAMLALPGEVLLDRTRAAWLQFSLRHANQITPRLAQAPWYDRLLRAVDDVSVLIKVQQAAEGGVLAGHNYHLCYVRDQYGVSRGLLAAGHDAEARAILDFYWRIWQRHGCIHNAQAAGVDGAFHIHENDEVEITGYVIRQAFDLLHATNNAEFVKGIFPMLAWAYEVQQRHLIEAMLPFNGDETYVAGGILPRTALNDGSAEATLLFLDSGTQLVSWVAQQGLWSEGKVNAERALLARIRDAYRANFWVSGQLATNNPLRASLPGGSPRFRHGVCERCMAEGRFRTIGWTERSSHGHYLCPECLARDQLTGADDRPDRSRRYYLQSVSLTPLYFHSDLFDSEELRPSIETILDAYRRTGRLPSRSDDTRDIAVGYDYGFLLYALTELAHPFASDIAAQTLALVDATGAWVEYYEGHRPSGTRCRPWESAINLEALLLWARRNSGF